MIWRNLPRSGLRCAGTFKAFFTVPLWKAMPVELNLAGCVRNLPDNKVEVVAEGEKQKLEKLLERLKKGPPAARVDNVEVIWGEFTGDFTQFSVKY